MMNTCGVAGYRLDLMGEKSAAMIALISESCVPGSDVVLFYEAGKRWLCTIKDLLGFQVLILSAICSSCWESEIFGEPGAHGKL